MDNNTPKKKFHYNYLSIALIYIWSIIFLISASKIKDPQSRIFPYIICGLAMVMGAVLFVRTYFRSGIHAVLPDFTGSGRAFVQAGLLVLYVLLIQAIGFYIATPIYMCAAMWVLGVRKKKVMILFSLFTILGVYIFFKLLLKMEIPLGLLGDYIRNM